MGRKEKMSRKKSRGSKKKRNSEEGVHVAEFQNFDSKGKRAREERNEGREISNGPILWKIPCSGKIVE